MSETQIPTASIAEPPPDPLDAAFSALSDPTRRAILARLASGEASVTELAQPFAMSLPGISKHLKVLERAGLIARSREAQWRPCRLNPQALKTVADWIDEYRRFFDQSLDRLDSYLQHLQAQQSSVSGPAANPTAAEKTSKEPAHDRDDRTTEEK